MNIQNLSDKLLIQLHDAIRDAFEEDERLSEGNKQYGVREFADWRATSDAFEAELQQRSLDVEPIPWARPPLPKDAARVFYYGKRTLGAASLPNPGEVYVIQRTHGGNFFVEKMDGGLAVQLAGPFHDVQQSLIEAAHF